MTDTKLKIAISAGNTKTGAVPAVSFPPCYGCPKDAPCKKDCYAKKAFTQYRQTRAAWTRNARLWEKSPTAFFNQLAEYIQKKKPRFFRFHVSGDIPNADYLARLKILSLQFPETKILAFTKQYDHNYRNLPENLSIVFSMWNNYGTKRKQIARAWFRDPANPDPRIPADALECPSNCETCGFCWNLKNINKDVVFNKH